jgi:hypothetical protein
VATVEYTGSTGRSLYDLADPNKRGAKLVYTGVCSPSDRPINQYGAFNTRGNRGKSQYHGLTFGLESRRLGNSGLQFTAVHAGRPGQPELHLLGLPQQLQPGYLDAFDPELDYGYALFDVRHRLVFAGLWEVPIFRNSEGATKTLLGGWQLNWIFTARTGYAFTTYDCTNAQFAVCMRAEDPVGIDKNATDGPGTGNPNEFTLLDLTPIMGSAGAYVNPLTGNSEFGPWPSTAGKQGDSGARRLEPRPAARQALPLRRPLRDSAALRGVQRVQPREHVRAGAERRHQQLHHDHRLQGGQPPHPARGEVRVLA